MKKKEHFVSVEKLWYQTIINENQKLSKQIMELLSRDYVAENQRMRDESNHLHALHYIDNLYIKKHKREKFAILIDCCEFFYENNKNGNSEYLMKTFLDNAISKYNLEEVCDGL